jgi:iron complex outermembrane receptor protein
MFSRLFCPTFRTASLGVAVQLFAASLLLAQDTGSIHGRLLTEDESPVLDATVTVTELRRQVAVDSQGAFEFSGLPAGSYLLRAESDRHGTAVERVEVTSGEPLEVVLLMGAHHHSDAIVVTAPGELRSQLELATPVTVLSDETLELRVQPTLGDTLGDQAGISQTWFAPGASRPIIRGLGSDRVRMLQGGLSSGDVSSTSPDHAVAVDPGTAQRVEVLRGPSTLLYGSTAIGGVVNVIDNTIPQVQPTESITGSVAARGGTVADELYGQFDLNGGFGNWAWHLDAALRETDDYSIPDDYDPEDYDHEEGEHHDEGEEHEGHEDEEEFTPGTLANSDLETRSAAGGLTYFAKKGFIGVSVSGFDTNYGVPGGHGHHGEEHDEGEDHDEGEEEEEADVRIDLERRRIDLDGEITEPFSIFRGFKARLGYVDYEHMELEGVEIGTQFLKETFEGRFEFVQKQRGEWSGSFGLQILDDDLEAIGEEAFLPPSSTQTLGLFAFQELGTGDLSWQFGGRIESADNSTRETDLPDRSFTPLSLSVGLVWDFGQEWSLGASLAASQKAPNASELYSDGAHAATQTFEIGDSDLDIESSLGLDVSVRRGGGPLHGELTLFLNRFDDFIYQMLTGEEIEGFDVLQYTQADAEFQGGELDIEYDLWERSHNHLDLKLMADYVQAELRDTGEPLPFIPPFRIGGGLHYGSQHWHAAGEIRWVDEQSRVAEEELPTPSYTMVNASVGYRFYFQSTLIDVLLRGTNLTDELAFNASSVQKFQRPMPGRDISLLARLSF